MILRKTELDDYLKPDPEKEWGHYYLPKTAPKHIKAMAQERNRVMSQINQEYLPHPPIRIEE